MTLIDVESTGTRMLMTTARWQLEPIPQYPRPPREAAEFNDWRRASRHSLGDVARALGTTPSRVSGLQHGRTRPEGDDWAGLLEFVAEALGPAGPPASG